MDEIVGAHRHVQVFDAHFTAEPLKARQDQGVRYGPIDPASALEKPGAPLRDCELAIVMTPSSERLVHVAMQPRPRKRAVADIGRSVDILDHVFYDGCLMRGTKPVTDIF